MSKNNNVYLVGPMGAGKTTIGRLLAAELRLEFKDTDKEIEERSGVDIPWIFDMEGEGGFRKRETAMLAELVEQDAILLATGGGIVMKEENRRLLSKHGQVVYLYTSIEEQVKRTARDKNRPLLQTDDPGQVLTELMEKRDPLYRDVADIVFDTDGHSPKSVAHELAKQLSGA
jgi:shikimate kinase